MGDYSEQEFVFRCSWNILFELWNSYETQLVIVGKVLVREREREEGQYWVLGNVLRNCDEPWKHDWFIHLSFICTWWRKIEWNTRKAREWEKIWRKGEKRDSSIGRMTRYYTDYGSEWEWWERVNGIEGRNEVDQVRILCYTSISLKLVHWKGERKGRDCLRRRNLFVWSRRRNSTPSKNSSEWR